MSKAKKKKIEQPQQILATEHRLLWDISRKETNTAALLTLATAAVEGTLQMRKDEPAGKYPAFAFRLCEKILYAPAGNNNVDYENDAANYMLMLHRQKALPESFANKKESAIRTARNQLYCSENFGIMVR